MACLDTTFLIDLARKQGGRKSRARAMLRDLVAAEERLCTTRFTMAELYVGVYRSRDLEAERAAVAAVLDGIEVLEFAPVAAQLRLLLSSSNLSTGKSDANVGRHRLGQHKFVQCHEPALPPLESAAVRRCRICTAFRLFT